MGDGVQIRTDDDTVKHYAAPWSRALMVSSLVITVLIALSSAVVIVAGVPGAAVVPFALWLHSMAFMVRGYTVQPGEILVRRSLWSTHLSLSGLDSVRHDSSVAKSSWRLFGNGGLIANTGWYYNRRLGKFRAFVTDPGRAVVLKYATRTVVISPDDPDGFVELVRQSQPNGVQPSGA